jgi:hypothetical protein
MTTNSKNQFILDIRMLYCIIVINFHNNKNKVIINENNEAIRIIIIIPLKIPN